ncbi:MAG: hypothetical protein PHQ23_02280 [Candidatus Wallbacteria bacterium]|nr:hypothetical protein [Candidatus Wallbacteria bacterium]
MNLEDILQNDFPEVVRQSADSADIFLLQDIAFARLVRHKPLRFFFLLPDHFQDPTRTLKPVNADGMNFMLELSGNRSEKYALFAFRTAISHQKKISPATAGHFDLRKELSGLTRAFLSDLCMQREEWDSLLCFLESSGAGKHKEIVLSSVLECLAEIISSRLGMVKISRTGVLFQLEAVVTGQPFCIMNGRDNGNLMLLFPDNIPSVMKSTSEPGWYELSPILFHQDFNQILDFIRESLGQVTHGRFWK